MHRPTLFRRLFTLTRRQSTVIRPIMHPITHLITHMGQDTPLAFPGVMVATGITAVTAGTVITVDMGATTVVGAAIDKSPQCLKI